MNKKCCNPFHFWVFLLYKNDYSQKNGGRQCYENLHTSYLPRPYIKWYTNLTGNNISSPIMSKNLGGVPLQVAIKHVLLQFLQITAI
jgi:hypothetical protein